jgi:hypothetical protein
MAPGQDEFQSHRISLFRPYLLRFDRTQSGYRRHPSDEITGRTRGADCQEGSKNPKTIGTDVCFLTLLKNHVRSKRLNERGVELPVSFQAVRFYPWHRNPPIECFLWRPKEKESCTCFLPTFTSSPPAWKYLYGKTLRRSEAHKTEVKNSVTEVQDEVRANGPESDRTNSSSL